MFLALTAFVIGTKMLSGAGQANNANCPRTQIKFEKIIGLRPSNLGYLLHGDQNRGPVTLDCLAKCLQLENCLGFVVFYKVSECYWHEYNPQGLQEFENIADSDAAWFVKTCLKAPGSCNKAWLFDRVPGFTLIGHNTKTLTDQLTRSECQQRCLDDSEIECKSALFTIHDGFNSSVTLGTCTLSDTDRHYSPNAYRASGYNEEYFDNQCTNVTRKHFCAYEQYESAILPHVDLKFPNVSKAGCEELCETTEPFVCRGYSHFSANATDVCLIHSEDTKIHGPGMLKHVSGARYYEKARCINVTVTCSETLLIVRYQPEEDFFGKIYMSGYSDKLECYAKGRERQTVKLAIPIFGNSCGVTEAKSAEFNRTLYSGNMVIQYNPIIQTQGDRLIRVGCIFTNESRVVLGTGVTFNNTASSNIGTTVINSTSPIQPVIQMRIVDYYSQQEIADTQIGQELQLIIEISPPNATYDISAGHLLAMTEDVNESILLLDDQGCPTNANVFPSLTKIRTNETRRLFANFQAFKFTTSPIVRFSVIVQYCQIRCATVSCGSRRKRESAVVTPYDNRTQLPLELVIIVRNGKPIPDRLVIGDSKILVAGYDYVTDEVCVNYSLFIGGTIVWVFMQVILVVVCVLIVRHYKNYYDNVNMAQSLEELNRNFGFGFSNRRVHWADDDFT